MPLKKQIFMRVYFKDTNWILSKNIVVNNLFYGNNTRTYDDRNKYEQRFSQKDSFCQSIHLKMDLCEAFFHASDDFSN